MVGREEGWNFSWYFLKHVHSVMSNKNCGVPTTFENDCCFDVLSSQLAIADVQFTRTDIKRQTRFLSFLALSAKQITNQDEVFLANPEHSYL